MNLRNNYFTSPKKLVVLTFGDFDNHESVLKEMSFLLILETSSNLKKPANDKTYKVILRSSTGLSRLERLIISWIAQDKIGSLRLIAAVPIILFDSDLTASAIGLAVGEEIPAKLCAHFMP